MRDWNLVHYEGFVRPDLEGAFCFCFFADNSFREGKRSFLGKKFRFGGKGRAEKMGGYKIQAQIKCCIRSAAKRGSKLRWVEEPEGQETQATSVQTRGHTYRYQEL